MEYYVNMIHNTDNFIANLIDAVNRRGEDTIIVMFGDHHPTMGLEDSDMKSAIIFKTKYATWNNFGLPKQDADLTAYQLLAHIRSDGYPLKEPCLLTHRHRQIPPLTRMVLTNLQYDLLYGEICLQRRGFLSGNGSCHGRGRRQCNVRPQKCIE